MKFLIDVPTVSGSSMSLSIFSSEEVTAYTYNLITPETALRLAEAITLAARACQVAVNEPLPVAPQGDAAQ